LLLDSRLRPSKVVGLEKSQLEALAAAATLTQRSDGDLAQDDVVSVLKSHDLGQLTEFLRRKMRHHGVDSFVRDVIPQLNVQIGDAWLRGDLKIFEEHLYAQSVQDFLQGVIASIDTGKGSPHVLLTTAPGEVHSLGLLMAKVVLTLNGASCVLMGVQMPVPEIVSAAMAMKFDVVGLSFSVSQPVRVITRFLTELRDSLDPKVQIWAGGMGAERLSKRIPGIVITTSFEAALAALQSLRL